MLPERSKRRNLVERIRLRRTPEAFLGTWLLGAPTWCSTGRRVGSSHPTLTPSLAQTSVSHDLHGSSPDQHVSPIAVSSSRQTCDVIKQDVHSFAIELRRLSWFLQHYPLIRHYFEVC